MKKQQILEELLQNESVKKIQADVGNRKETLVHQLHFITSDDLVQEAYRWANSLFVAAKSGDSRPERMDYRDSILLTHPEGFTIRAYYPSGFIEYCNIPRMYAGRTSVTTNEEANSIVQHFASEHAVWPLDSYGQVNLKDLKFVKSQGISSGNVKTDVITNNAIVRYQRVTDGLPWVGPGSQIIAVIEDRDVVSFTLNWRRLITKRESVPLLPVEKALEALLNDLSARRDNKVIESGEIVLQRVEFGYYAADNLTIQRFLQPAYLFYYNTVGRFKASFVDVRPAHEQQFEKLVPDIQSANTQPRQSV